MATRQSTYPTKKTTGLPGVRGGAGVHHQAKKPWVTGQKSPSPASGQVTWHPLLSISAKRLMWQAKGLVLTGLEVGHTWLCHSLAA